MAMDFTFDNPFDDVFDAAPTTTVAAVAETTPNPAPVEPVQQQPATVVQPVQAVPVTAPVTANPTQPSLASHSATVPAQNPAIASPQMFAPLVPPTQPVAAQPVATGTF